jgi:hypothetical protein
MREKNIMRVIKKEISTNKRNKLKDQQTKRGKKKEQKIDIIPSQFFILVYNRNIIN